MTQNIEESLSALQNVQLTNQVLKTGSLAGLQSQLHVMEELGKAVRDTPITIHDSESQSIIG